MKRVASLYLPNLGIERLRRSAPAPRPSAPEGRPRDVRDWIPASAGELLATTQRSGQRILLAAVSPEAAALGLYPGMPVTQARVLAPGLELRDADPEGDAAFLTRLALFAASRWTPAAALSGADGLWLDISGGSHLFGGEAAMCRRILRFCARLGFTARVAIAGTTGAAHALARFGADRITLCPKGGEAQALAQLPLAALRLEDAVLAAAKHFGIGSIGELIAMPRGPLARRFGRRTVERIDQALGRIAEPFDPIVPHEPPRALLRLLEPIATAEAIARVLCDLMAMLINRLERASLGVRRVTLICHRVDGEAQSLAIGTVSATRNAAHLIHMLGLKIETIEPGFGIEAMELVAVRSEPLRPSQIGHDLGDIAFVSELPALIDRIAGRIGMDRLFRATLVESDVPERSVRHVSPLAEASDWPRDWPRPARLLPFPEPVQKVIAELPDQPPLRFAWRGEMHRVCKAGGPERIHGEWWKHSSEADAVRDYFQVEDESGARFWLFRRGDGTDPRTGDLSWWMHGAMG